MGAESDNNTFHSAREFRTTHWSVVLQARAGDSPEQRSALERLCRAYWYPLYSFVRRRGRDAHEAEDLTQAFFERFLEKDYLADVSAVNSMNCASGTWRARHLKFKTRSTRASPETKLGSSATGRSTRSPGRMRRN